MVHHDGGPPSCIAPGFEFHSFQFFQKCLLFDLTLTSCLAEIENKIWPVVPYWIWQRRNVILNASKVASLGVTAFRFSQYGKKQIGSKILFSISAGQEVSVKSKKRHFWKNWNEWNSNPGGIHDGGPPSWWTMHLEVEQKYYLRQ